MNSKGFCLDQLHLFCFTSGLYENHFLGIFFAPSQAMAASVGAMISSVPEVMNGKTSP